MHLLNGWAMMIGGNISELKIVVSLATDKVKQGVASVKTQMTSLKRSVDNATAGIKPSFKKVVKPIEDVSTSTKEASFAMKMFGQGGASVANTLSIALSKINPQFGQMREGISAVGSSMKGLAKTSKGAMVAVGAAIAAIAAVAIANVAKAMYDRISELVAFAAPDEYKKATEGMNNAINKLKTSIGTVLVPIFSMLSKAIEVVADALSWFVEKVVAPYWGFISGMFGWMDAFDTSGVSSVSDTMSDASDSTGKMADDVKEMGKGLAGFDKLTVQAKSSDSSSASTDDTPLGNVDDVKRNAEQYNKIKESMMGGAKFAEKIKTKISAILEPVKRAIVRIKGIIDKIVKAVSTIDLKKTLNDAKARVLGLASTIKGKIDNLNKAIEGGNITRTVLCQLEDQIGADGAMFKPYTDEQMAVVNRTLSRMMDDTYTADGRLQPEMHLDMSWLDKDVRKWCVRMGTEALKAASVSMDVFRKRASVSAFRAATLCYYLYRLEGEVSDTLAQNRCRRIYLFMADYILSMMLKRWGKRYEELLRKREEKTPQEGQVKLIDRLPDVFSREQLRTLIKEHNVATPDRVLISQWRAKGLIETVEKFRYRKLS